MDYIKKTIKFIWRPDPVDIQCHAAEKALARCDSPTARGNQLDDVTNAFDLTLAAWHKETAQRHPHFTYLLVNYATTLWNKYKLLPAENVGERYKQLKQIILLDEHALELWREERPLGDAYPTLLCNLANAYFDRATLSGGNHFYQESIDLNRQVYEEEIEGNEGYSPSRRANAALGIARALWTRNDKALPQGTRNFELDEALLKAKEAQASHGDNVETRVAYLTLLSEVYGGRSRMSKKAEDISKAIQCNQDVLCLLHHGDPRRPPFQYNLALELLHKYNLFNDDGDLKEAQKVASEGMTGVTDQALRAKFEDVVNRATRKNTGQ